MNREANPPRPQESSPPGDGELAGAPPPRRWGLVLAALVIALSVVGFISGILDLAEPTKPPQVQSKLSNAGETLLVPDYRQMNSAAYGPNRNWHSDLSRLPQSTPGMFDQVIRTPELKTAALHDRLRTRAFDGAPPAIPHVVSQTNADSCLACHGKGMILDGKVATRMSHQLLTNCTQCHVETSSTMTSEPEAIAPDSQPLALASTGGAAVADNSFAGILRAGPGTRLFAGAPPTIPHALHMREDCLSCHGLVARPGLRTTHPWLTNCQQCHAADAERERSFAVLTGENLPVVWPMGNTSQ